MYCLIPGEASRVPRIGSGDRGTEYTSCVLEHEVYLLCVDFLGGDDEVALVFAIFVIYNDDKLTFLEVLYCIFDAIELISAICLILL